MPACGLASFVETVVLKGEVDEVWCGEEWEDTVGGAGSGAICEIGVEADVEAGVVVDAVGGVGGVCDDGVVAFLKAVAVCGGVGEGVDVNGACSARSSSRRSRIRAPDADGSTKRTRSLYRRAAGCAIASSPVSLVVPGLSVLYSLSS